MEANCLAGSATCCTASRPRTHLAARRAYLHAGVTSRCRAVLSPELVFTAATVAVMPIYTMMIGFQQHPQVSFVHAESSFFDTSDSSLQLGLKFKRGQRRRFGC